MAFITAMISACNTNGSRNSNATEAATTVQTNSNPIAVSDESLPEAPDFTLNDTKGKPLALSSLRGKYVVLDFWGSWCKWCIKGFPMMKEYYEKHQGKFEILGIDCGDSEEEWLTAVDNYQLPWLNVYNPSNSELPDIYGVEGFPTKVIINPDGKVLKTIVGEDAAFYTLLDQLLSQ